VCGTDRQCRVACDLESPSCIDDQECVAAAGVTACFDPANAQDEAALSEGGIVGDGGVAHEGGDAGDDATPAVGDGAASDGGTLDATLDASMPFTPNPDAGGGLGFAAPNVDLGTLDAGVDAGDAGIFSGALGPLVTVSCNDTSCLPAPVTLQMTNGSPAALYVFDQLTVAQSAALRFTGTLPIVVVARTSVNIQGQILVNGTALGGPGPGGFAGVNPGPGIGGNGASAAYADSASGGGSYCGGGGSGATGASPAAPGGPTYGDPELTTLVGGSAGGSLVSGGGNTGGPGGGAIEIVAGQSITIGALAAIHAGGGGGCGYDYAGGGGAGGSILLTAPLVTVDGVLAANGGGGGQEEGSPMSGCGGDSTPSDQPAPGFAGIGGSGSAGSVIAGANGVVPDAGSGYGAGGGGAGRIRIDTAVGGLSIGDSAVVSPALAQADGGGTPCATTGTIAP
jgi:hypothetical protein